MNDLTILSLDRNKIVEVSAPVVKDLILQTHSKPEAMAKLSWLLKTLEEVDKSIRKDLLEVMEKDRLDRDAYGRFTIGLVKAKAHWGYIADAKHQQLKAKFDQAKKELDDYQKVMQENGGAVDENEDRMALQLRERQLTVKSRRV